VIPSKASLIPRDQRLTLGEPAGNGLTWATCRCGSCVKVVAKDVRRGTKRSCGCLDKELSLAGRKPITTALPDSRYGKWTVKGDATRDKSGKRRVHVECDCGIKSIAYASALEAKRSKSCIMCCAQGRPKKQKSNDEPRTVPE
jgi:hypothetical protein